MSPADADVDGVNRNNVGRRAPDGPILDLNNRQVTAMDRDAFDLLLEATDRAVATRPAPSASGAVSSDEPPRLSFDLADFEEDDEGTSGFTDLGAPGDRLENTELVAAAFRAAGNPKYQDVRLKGASPANYRVPTYREIAQQRAKRVNSSAAW
jgi:hypothetical protein